ncbi:sodium- and chloride-dependent neutral and basic amino acid transporter B(0+)-like [Penaeus monodon]|uniref:sodium- and chloride-dependent neutral and basic amino acid transporter B(0+)-like n=1 Tax=Penaeus monodon TaxID=6687 RepID=UPI0018A6FDAE|nr:sodium- and chloride-dependent neutral and basic amino acid transporter B(0+)-like [Penaeus monodon]
MYSLGLAHAGIHTLASYNTFRHNILRDAILLVLVDTVTSILCTLVVFSSLATIAEDLPTEEQELTKLVFVVFPGLLSKIDTHPWPIIVFCMIFFFGFNSQFAMVETITTAFFDQFHALRRCYVPVVVATCAVLFTTGIPMCMRGGITFFQFLDKNITAHSFLFLGLSEVFIVSYAYGFENFMSIIRDRMKVSVFKPFYWYFKVMYTVVTPFFMLVCLAHSLHKRDWSRDAWGVTGIAFALFPFVVVGVGAVCALGRNRSMGLASLLRPTSDFCPEYERRERAASPQTFELQASATPRLPRGG